MPDRMTEWLAVKTDALQLGQTPCRNSRGAPEGARRNWPFALLGSTKYSDSEMGAVSKDKRSVHRLRERDSHTISWSEPWFLTLRRLPAQGTVNLDPLAILHFFKQLNLGGHTQARDYQQLFKDAFGLFIWALFAISPHSMTLGGDDERRGTLPDP